MQEASTHAGMSTAIRRSLVPSAGRSSDASFVLRVLEEIDYGLLLVEPDGLLQHANRLAREELGRARLLRLEQGRLAGASQLQTEQVLRAVHAAALGRRQMLTLASGSERLPVACVPLNQPPQDGPCSVLLMLARQPGMENLNLSFFSRSHGLTPAEEGVLKGLCRGLGVQEIATTHRVSECTVRTQIRSLRDKTGINSIRLLVQHVAALPPLVPMSLTLSSAPGAESPM